MFPLVAALKIIKLATTYASFNFTELSWSVSQNKSYKSKIEKKSETSHKNKINKPLKTKTVLSKWKPALQVWVCYARLLLSATEKQSSSSTARHRHCCDWVLSRFTCVKGLANQKTRPLILAYTLHTDHGLKKLYMAFKIV